MESHIHLANATSLTTNLVLQNISESTSMVNKQKGQTCKFSDRNQIQDETKTKGTEQLTNSFKN